MKPLSFLFLLLFLCQACIKEPASPLQNQVKTDMSDLVIPESFSWSGINHSDLTINVVNAQGAPSNQLNGQPLDLLDADGNRIARTVVDETTAQFMLSIPSGVTQLVVSSPVTQTTVPVSLLITRLNFPAPANAAALFAAQPDSDSDGIPNPWDEYPDDPEQAYSFDFPALPNSSYLAETRALEASLRSETDATLYYYQIFEDRWPEKGDYDLNDLIMRSRLKLTANGQGYIVSGWVRSQIWAVGASTALPHGFGFEFFKRTSGSSLSYMSPGTVTLVSRPRYAQNSDLTGFSKIDSENKNSIILFENVLQVMNPYYNNVGGSWGVAGVPQTCYFEFTVSRDAKAKSLELLAYLYNTSDRSLSIRTFGTPPTENSHKGRFGIRDDASASPAEWSWNAGRIFTFPLTGQNAFYRTRENLPWAVEFAGNSYRVPNESTSILQAYPKFQQWAESGGAEATDWFKYPDTALTLEVPK